VLLPNADNNVTTLLFPYEPVATVDQLNTPLPFVVRT